MTICIVVIVSISCMGNMIIIVIIIVVIIVIVVGRRLVWVLFGLLFWCGLLVGTRLVSKVSEADNDIVVIDCHWLWQCDHWHLHLLECCHHCWYHGTCFSYQFLFLVLQIGEFVQVGVLYWC